MAALGIITLVLTGFTIVYYCYIANHTDEHDVSFFISVGLISMVMNLCTQAGGVFALSWLYFAIDILFIALSFAVSVQGSIGFYKSIGPWFKNVFSNFGMIGWQLLSFILFPAGVVLYFALFRSKSEVALACGKMALWGMLFWLLAVWAVLGLVL